MRLSSSEKLRESQPQPSGSAQRWATMARSFAHIAKDIHGKTHGAQFTFPSPQADFSNERVTCKGVRSYF